MNELWKFKRSLTSLETYSNSNVFKTEIQRGNRDVLMQSLSEIQMILSQPNQKPYAKLLSLRFCKDIMLLGKPEVVTAMERLLPSMTKIASYRLQSKDPNRGSTYFRNLPEYSQLSAQQKKNTDLVGTSLILMALQNIKMWAQWIPTNPNGSESMYRKSYNSLLQRGVTFPIQMSYYKQKDTERFNQTYKVEFFSNSDIIDESQIDIAPDFAAHLRRLIEHRQTLQYLLQNQSTQEFQTFYRKVTIINRDSANIRDYLQKNHMNFELNQLMSQQKWIDSYLQNYQLLNDKKINYVQFSKLLVERLPGFVLSPRPTNIIKKQFQFQSPMRPAITTVPSPYLSNMSRETIKYDQVDISVPMPISQISQSDRIKISTLQNQLRGLQSQKQAFRGQLELMRIQYQSKINHLREQLQSQSNTNDGLSKQIVNLKSQIQQLINAHSIQVSNLVKQMNDVKVFSNKKVLQIQHVRAEQEAEEIRKLKYQIQQQRTQKVKLAQDVGILRQQVFKLQQQLHNTKVQNQNVEMVLDKYAKQKNRLEQQMGIYKNQLSQQRSKQHEGRDLEITRLNQIIIKLTNQLDITKQQFFNKVQQATDKDNKLLNMHKKMVLVEEQRRRQVINYHQTQAQLPSPVLQQRQYQLQHSKSQQQLFSNSFRTDIIASRPFNLKQMIGGMDQYYTFFVQNPKQLRLRFCKSALKSKELLFKSNELQIGVIWNRVSNNKLKAIFHYTNNSNSQIFDFKSKIYSPKGMKTQILSILPSTLSVTEQQKQEMMFQILELPLRPVLLQISYLKDGQIKLLTLLLPIFLLKFVEYFPPRRIFAQMVNRRQFYPSIKITRNLTSYFEQLRQSGNNRYEVDVAYNLMNLAFKLVMILEQGEMLILQTYTETLSTEQKKALEEYLNELQYVLS